MMKIEIILILLANLLLETNARYIKADGTKCKAESFGHENIKQLNFIEQTADLDKVSIKFTDEFKPNITFPSSDFADKEEYTNICLKSKNFKLVKPGDLQTIIDQTELNVNQNEVEFSKLDYMTAYKIKLSYVQSFPDDTEHEATVLDLFTCFGPPDKVKNLQANASEDGKTLEIKWDKPVEIRAPNVCYYELKVFEQGNPSNIIIQKSTDIASESITIDTSKPYDISVIPINSVFKAQTTTLCYPRPRAPGECKQKSGSEETYSYIPENYTMPTIPTMTTTSDMTTQSGSIKNQFSFFMIISLIISYFSIFFL